MAEGVIWAYGEPPVQSIEDIATGTQPAANNTAKQEAGFFDATAWGSTARNILTGLVAGKINKQYGLDLSGGMPYERSPNGTLAVAGGQAAYSAVSSGAAGTALQAAGFVQRNGVWIALGVGGLVLAFLLLRK